MMDFVELLRQFARRTARQKGVQDPAAKAELRLINHLARNAVFRLARQK